MTCPRLLYAASESSADMLYALGFMLPDPALWYEINGKPTVVMSPLELGRAQREAKPELEVKATATLHNELGLDSAKPGDMAEVITALSKRYDVTRWQVPYDFPTGLVVKLAANHIEVDPVRDFWPQRRHKDAGEIEAVREGVGLAQHGLEHAVTILREAVPDNDERLMWRGQPLTSEILRGEINAEIARSGGTASHTIAAPGCQAADPHCTGYGQILLNQPVVIDIFPRVNATGYHGDLTRTVVKGRAADIVQKAFTTVNAARQAAIKVVNPGVAVREVHEAAAATIRDKGFETDVNSATPSGFIHGVGHGLGLDVHEAPGMNARNDTCLAPGDVITIEPGVYYPDWGGMRIEDVLVVTEDGSRNLTTAPVSLELD